MEYVFQIFSKGAGVVGAGWTFAITVGLAISLITLAVALGLRGLFDPLRSRVRSLVPATATPGTHPAVARLVQMIAPLAPYLMPKKETERSDIQARLLQAGFPSDTAATTFFSLKVLLGVALAVLVLIAGSIYPRFTATQLWYAAAIAGFCGLILPNMVLTRKIEKRQRQIMNGFPDALDLIVACTEAGLGLNAALQRVANELDLSHPQLSFELALVNSEMRAGVDRVTALRNLAARTGLEDIRGLVSLLSQSMRFGTSIADTLRIYASELRDKRMQRAEEEAAKIGTKMIFPLVCCVFPSFFVVMVGPAIVGVLRVLRAQ